jgi:GNAT superfamily N-acetyltransferase
MVNSGRRVIVRVAELGDETRLFDLVRRFPTPTPPDVSAFSAAFKTKLPDPSACLLVAEHDRALIGYVTGYSHPTFYAGGNTAWVDEILVDSAFRNRGAGRELMAAFEQWAVGRGCKLVSLATGTAGTFYERLNYASTAEYYKKYL